MARRGSSTGGENIPPSNESAVSLTLDIDGAQITLERFQRAIESFFTLIKNVSREVAGDGKPLKWTVAVRKGSALIDAKAVSDTETIRNAERVVRAIPEGIRLLEKGTEHFPAYFTDDAIAAAHDLASVRDKHGKQVKHIKIRTTGKPTILSSKTIVSADRLMGNQHQAYGSIQGRLLTISDRGGFKFAVYDELFDQRISCFVGEELVKQAIEGFRHRVTVYGVVQYNTAGDPRSIRVEKIEFFKLRHELTPLSRIEGILQNL